MIPPYFWQDPLIYAVVTGFAAGLSTGLWAGWKLWRQVYVRGIDGNTIRNVRWRQPD